MDTGARFERIAELQRGIETTERQLEELTTERGELDRDHVNANDLYRTLAEFDAIWSSLSTKEQYQMIHLLVAKVGYPRRVRPDGVLSAGRGCSVHRPRCLGT